MFRSMDALVEERRVGPYVLRERLGRGGMGHVYKAEHRLLKRVVALKLVSRREAARANRFRREVEAAGRLCHPNIVAAYDAGAAHGWLYLAMEYIEGVDLQRLVEESGPLSVDLACEIVRQTAEALHHAHERGLVHRDIKPSNLMLAAPVVTVKLLDLGLAQLTDPDSSSAGEVESDPELCGTPDFMAPEWGQAPRRADVRGDLYSLGCTFYFLLCGQVPYPGGSCAEKLLHHCLDAPTPLRHLRPEVPVQVAAIVDRLMARAVENRYANAAEVAAQVAALRFASSPISEGYKTEDSQPPSQPRSSLRAARFAIAAFVAVLLGVATAGGARWMLAASFASPQRKHGKKLPLLALRSAKIMPVGVPFTIAGRSTGFSSLANAIAAAKDGDVITIHGAGPFETPPLSWRSKALTLRAGSGTRPRLEMKDGDDPWQALLQTDGTLTLEGLDLAIVEDKSRMRQGPAAPLIHCTQAPLHLMNCRLTGGADGAAIVARNCRDVIVRGCRIEAGAVGLSIEVGHDSTARIRLEDSQLKVRDEGGTALSLWAAELPQGAPIELELEGNTIEAGRMTTLRALPAGLTIRARGNHFLYRTALLSYFGFAERDAWRGTIWQGGDNRYQGPASWLWVEGEPISLSSGGRLLSAVR